MACWLTSAVPGHQADHVGEHRAVELGRQPAGDVPAVVGGREEDGVGLVAGLDRAAMAAATGTPGSAPPRSPTS